MQPVNPVSASDVVLTDVVSSEGYSSKTSAYMADQRLVEDFAKLVAETAGNDCLAAVALPWTGGNGNPPDGVICPTSQEGLLDMNELQNALQNKQMILLACTFKHQEEENAAFKVVKQLEPFQGKKCILTAHLLAPGENHYDRENYATLMTVHEKFHKLGANDVLLDPEWVPGRLQLRIKMALHSWSINQERLQAMLAEEPQPPPKEEIQALEAAQRQLLWQDIPRELMPRFKVMNADLEETEIKVGDYTLGKTLESRNGVVREARDKHGRMVAIKVLCKKDVFTPAEVEGIYREFRFLVGFVKHRHIVRALDCFHGQKNVYTVMQLLNGKNLACLLDDLPGVRFNSDDAMTHFFQIASAVNHCHQKDVVHRAICLEHVVMRRYSDGKYVPKLIDFRSAMIAKKGITSVAKCGTLPCMSPCMLSGSQYLPKCADCWSCGVMLLEMAGGKGSFFHAVGLDEATAKQIPDSGDPNARNALADKITSYFETPGNHAAALARMGNICHTDIQDMLEHLILPNSKGPSIESFLEIHGGGEAVDDEDDSQDAAAAETEAAP